MKPLSLGLIACAVVILLSQIGSSQDTAAPLHMIPAKDVSLTADSIVRRDPPKVSNANPYASEVQLKGHVEIMVCCVQNELPQALKETMIVNADEVDYHADTGNFEARGTVRVRFEDKMKH
jgi:hypothetical protein